MSRKRNNRPRPTGGKLPPVLQQLKHNLQGMSTQSLAVVLDATAAVLRERGAAIRVWNEKDRTVQKFGYIGGRVYALAPQGEPKPEETEHGENGEDTGGRAPDT